MKTILQIISYLGLAITILAPILLWAGTLEVATNRILLNIGMVLWFGAAIFWIKPHAES